MCTCSEVGDGIYIYICDYASTVYTVPFSHFGGIVVYTLALDQFHGSGYSKGRIQRYHQNSVFVLFEITGQSRGAF